MANNIFPLPFSAHLVFVAVAFIFFIVQFIRVRYKYQLIMACAVALTMLVYANDTRTWFYGIGMVEIGLILLSFVLLIVEKHARKKAAAENAPEEEQIESAPESETAPEETQE